MSAVIAGFGSELRGDDAVGLAVIRHLGGSPLPPGVRCVEIGVGGVWLAHELAGCDRLVVVDAAQRGGAPGTVYVLEPTIPDAAELSADERRALAADMHVADPVRALTLARAAGAVPAHVTIVGIEVGGMDDPLGDLTPAVARAVPIAAQRALALAAGATV